MMSLEDQQSLRCIRAEVTTFFRQISFETNKQELWPLLRRMEHFLAREARLLFHTCTEDATLVVPTGRSLQTFRILAVAQVCQLHSMLQRGAQPGHSVVTNPSVDRVHVLATHALKLLVVTQKSPKVLARLTFYILPVLQHLCFTHYCAHAQGWTWYSPRMTIPLLRCAEAHFLQTEPDRIKTSKQRSRQGRLACATLLACCTVMCYVNGRRRTMFEIFSPLAMRALLRSLCLGLINASDRSKRVNRSFLRAVASTLNDDSRSVIIPSFVKGSFVAHALQMCPFEYARNDADGFCVAALTMLVFTSNLRNDEKSIAMNGCWVLLGRVVLFAREGARHCSLSQPVAELVGDGAVVTALGDLVTEFVLKALGTDSLPLSLADLVQKRHLIAPRFTDESFWPTLRAVAQCQCFSTYFEPWARLRSLLSIAQAVASICFTHYIKGRRPITSATNHRWIHTFRCLSSRSRTNAVLCFPAWSYVPQALQQAKRGDEELIVQAAFNTFSQFSSVSRHIRFITSREASTYRHVCMSVVFPYLLSRCSMNRDATTTNERWVAQQRALVLAITRDRRQEAAVRLALYQWLRVVIACEMPMWRKMGNHVKGLKRLLHATEIRRQ